jgi:hypothetical protein
MFLAFKKVNSRGIAWPRKSYTQIFMYQRVKYLPGNKPKKV